MTPCSTKSTKASFSSGSARLRLKRLPLTTRRMTRSSISVRHKVSALAPITYSQRHAIAVVGVSRALCTPIKRANCKYKLAPL